MSTGHLTLYLGSMFSSKTTSLIRDVTRYADLGEKCLILNSALDTRPGLSSLSSHSSSYRGLSPKIDVQSVGDLATVNVQDYVVIGVDEAQFFPDLLATVLTWIDQQGKIVIVAGLDGNANRQPFGQILQLVPHAEEVTKLKARCEQCLAERRKTDSTLLLTKMEANFTRLRTQENLDQPVIGGSDKYQPVCRYHYNRS